MTVQLAALFLAALTVALWLEQRSWDRRHPKPPARPPAGLPPAGGSAGRAGTTTDEWLP